MQVSKLDLEKLLNFVSQTAALTTDHPELARRLAIIYTRIEDMLSLDGPPATPNVIQIENSPKYWKNFNRYCQCPLENHNDIGESGTYCPVCGKLVK